MKQATRLRVVRMCQLCGVPRAGFYRRRRETLPRMPVSMERRDAMQRICLQMPSYGWRRVTLEMQARGWEVNHKWVRRAMREDNLLCLRHRKFVVTTDSNHPLPVYPNLARDIALTGLDQLWIADITYIRLEDEFVYLAVILDSFSRRVIGWALADTLEAELTLAALRMALRRRQASPGLVHHSDRGVQYAAREYVELLEQHGIVVSMSRKGNPYDNARAESFMKTLKYEEVYRQEYRNRADVRDSIEHYVEKIYNRKRLHSAIGYQSPVNFERDWLAASGPA